jgi:transcription termination factor Rho
MELQLDRKLLTNVFSHWLTSSSTRRDDLLLDQKTLQECGLWEIPFRHESVEAMSL